MQQDDVEAYFLFKDTIDVVHLEGLDKVSTVNSLGKKYLKIE